MGYIKVLLCYQYYIFSILNRLNSRYIIFEYIFLIRKRVCRLFNQISKGSPTSQYFAEQNSLAVLFLKFYAYFCKPSISLLWYPHLPLGDYGVMRARWKSWGFLFIPTTSKVLRGDVRDVGETAIDGQLSAKELNYTGFTCFCILCVSISRNYVRSRLAWDRPLKKHFTCCSK